MVCLHATYLHHSLHIQLFVKNIILSSPFRQISNPLICSALSALFCCQLSLQCVEFNEFVSQPNLCLVQHACTPLCLYCLDHLLTSNSAKVHRYSPSSVTAFIERSARFGFGCISEIHRAANIFRRHLFIAMTFDNRNVNNNRQLMLTNAPAPS